MINEQTMKQIAQAVISECAELDGVQPEEMLRSVAAYLNGEPARPYCGIAEVVHHRGVKVSEEIVRKVAIAVIQEAEQLEGVDPEEMVQKVVAALQGESVTEVATRTNDSYIMKERGVQVDPVIAKRITEAVLKESAELDGVVPAEVLQKVLSALRPMQAAEVTDTFAASAAAKHCAVSSSCEIVVGIGSGFAKQIKETKNGICHTTLIHHLLCGAQSAGATVRFVRVLKSMDVSVIAREAAALSSSGVGIGLRADGAAAIWQGGVKERFDNPRLMTPETYGSIGANAAAYAAGKTVTPVKTLTLAEAPIRYAGECVQGSIPALDDCAVVTWSWA